MSTDPFSSMQAGYYEQPRRRGCFFYGCLITVILLILGAAAVSTLLYMGYRSLANTLLEHSDDSAQPLPKVELAPDARASLDERVKAFRKGMEEGKSPEPLVLNSDELNTLIREGVEDVGERVYVDIVGDKVEGRLTLPIEGLDLFGWFGLKGKFINAKGRFDVSLENGVLIVVLDDAQVKGKPLPEDLMKTLRGDNLAKEAYKNPDNADLLRKLESITVKDGKLIVKARSKAAESKDTTKADSETKEKKPEPDAIPAPKADSETKEKKPEPDAIPAPKADSETKEKKPEPDAKAKEEAKDKKDEPKDKKPEPAPAPKDEVKEKKPEAAPAPAPKDAPKDKKPEPDAKVKEEVKKP